MFSLLYTTARPHLIPEVVDRWLARVECLTGVEMVIVTDEPFRSTTPFADQVRLLVNGGRRDCVTGWNLAAANAVGDVFVQVSDDLHPPKHWDKAMREVIDQFMDQRPDVVLNLLDERLMASAIFHPVLTRAAYDKVGFLYPPDFESMFCDNWFTAFHGKYSLCMASKRQFWSHVHRTTHAVAVDDVMVRHESRERYERGRKTLEKYIRLHEL